MLPWRNDPEFLKLLEACRVMIDGDFAPCRPTDGWTFARLGIWTYGFLPMNLPAGFDHLVDQPLC